MDDEHKCEYVFFDTGVEYIATKEHLDFLEQKYGIKIRREKAIKTIPYSAKHYGQPFLNKYVSEVIEALQKANFGFENEPYETLLQWYPKCSKHALKWWTGEYDKGLWEAYPQQKGRSSQYSIKLL